MVNKIMIPFVVADFLFLASGASLIFVAILGRQKSDDSENAMISDIARRILLNQCPLTGAIANGVLVCFTFFLSLPIFILPTTKTWLRVHGWLVVVCAILSLYLGADIWVHTLKTRLNLEPLWRQQSTQVQSLLQQKFSCCGYLDNDTQLFVKDKVCTNALMASQHLGCAGKLSDFANGYLDLLFTALFGIVALDVVLILCVAMVLKDRKEKERYRHIDEKLERGYFKTSLHLSDDERRYWS